MGDRRSDPSDAHDHAIEDPLTGGEVVAERYALTHRLAEGGMGSVWQAYDRQLEREVAVKFMSSRIASDPALRRRFYREAKAAARLRTPHVVQIFEHGVHGELPYIVMELLEGEDLHARLKRDKRLPLAEAVTIVAQIARGLRAAHDAQVIHRDLKPQNIFLADEDGELRVKILDFGVAKITDAPSDNTKVGFVVGSPHYMSPEQARGLAVDARSDVWSLAVIAFRMVTGKMAFSGSNTGDVVVKICAEPLPVPSHKNPALPPAIDDFFARALTRDREERFPTAMALAHAFAEAVHGHAPMSSLPPPSFAGAQPPRPSLEAPPPRPSFAGEQPAREEPERTPASADDTPASAAPPAPAEVRSTPAPSLPPASGGLGSHTPATGPSTAAVAETIRPEAERPARSPHFRLVVGVVGGLLVFTLVMAVLSLGSDDGPAPAAPPPSQPPAPSPRTASAPAPSTRPSASTSAAASARNIPPPLRPRAPVSASPF
jgi:serine/threonine-protein kinase